MNPTSLTTGNLTYEPVGKNKGFMLATGEYMQVNDYMYTTVPGKYGYFAVLQPNGDLRFYYSELNDFNACDTDQPYYSLVCDSPSTSTDPSWHFNPGQTDGQYFAIMQTDGNFVIYRGTGPSDNHGPCWATNTWQQGQGPAYAAILTSTGILEVGVIPPGTTPSSQYPGLNITWQVLIDYSANRVVSGNCLQAGQWMTQDSSLYSASLSYGLTVQENGAITLSCTQPPGQRLVNAYGELVNQAHQYWTNNLSKPAGPCFTIMQADGNLCTYQGTDPGHNLGLYWAIASSARPAGNYVAAIGNDGTLAVHAGTDPNTTSAPLWTNASPASPADYAISVVSGGYQEIHATIGTFFPVAPMSVQLTRANGVPCPNDSVTFWQESTDGDGSTVTFVAADPQGQPAVTQLDAPTDSWGVATTGPFWAVSLSSPGSEFGIRAFPAANSYNPDVMLQIVALTPLP